MQIYASAGKLHMWRLGNGLMATLAGGYFLPGDSSGSVDASSASGESSAGPAAASSQALTHLHSSSSATATVTDKRVKKAISNELDPLASGFLRAHLPIFGVPPSIRRQLEAAGVAAVRYVSPSIVRTYLKNLARRSDAQLQNAFASESVPLLRFCMSDIIIPKPPPAPAVSQPNVAPTLGSTVDDATGSSTGDTSPATSGPPLIVDPAMVDAVPFILPSTRPNLSGLPAWYIEEQGQSAAASSSSAAAAAGSSVSSASASRRSSVSNVEEPDLDLQALRDCKGLPVPTAAGNFLTLGERSLFVLPTCRAGPSDTGPVRTSSSSRDPDTDGCSLDAAAAEPSAHEVLKACVTQYPLQQFLHPDFSAQAQPLLCIPRARQTLALNLYDFGHLSQQLEHTVGREWAHVGRTLRQVLPAAAPTAEWQDGKAGGPSPAWLQQVWHLIRLMQRSHSKWSAESGYEWSLIDAWPLIPVNGGQLLRIKHRALAFSPPAQALAVSQATGTGTSSEAGTEVTAMPHDASNLSDIATDLPEPWSWLLPAVERADCPVLDHSYAALCLAACCPPKGDHDTAAVVRKLRGCADAGLLHVDRLPQQLPLLLFQLLTQHVPDGIDQGDQDFLKQLPMYPTIAGTLTDLIAADNSAGSIQRHQLPLIPTGGSMSRCDAPIPESDQPVSPAPVSLAVHQCPASLLAHPPGLAAGLPAAVCCKLLEHRQQYTQLYSLLGVPLLDPATFLARVALPQLGQLTAGLQAMVLADVQYSWQELEQHEEVVEAMRDTAFVPTASGAIMRPTDLYDPTVQVRLPHRHLLPCRCPLISRSSHEYTPEFIIHVTSSSLLLLHLFRTF